MFLVVHFPNQFYRVFFRMLSIVFGVLNQHDIEQTDIKKEKEYKTKRIVKREGWVKSENSKDVTVVVVYIYT